MRKKLAGIHLLAPLSETDIVDYSRNLDRELIVNSTIVTDAIVDTVEKTNYIVTFEYDTTLDGGTHQIRRSIPTLELLSYTGENMSGAHWVNVEDMDYHYITPGTTAQQAFEELDEQLSKVSGLKYIIDGTGTGTLVSSLDGKTSSVTVDAGEYIIVLGESHTASNTEHSVILGGVGSDISASFGSMSRYNLIAASVNGRIQGNNSSMSVYGGIDNYIIGDSAVGNTIVNGRGNLIYGAIRESTIINGSDNIISISSKYGYADSVIESNKGYILDSEYSSVNNSARVTIMNSRYSTSDHSAYIEINNSNHCSVNSSEYTSIIDSAESNIINSVNSSDRLSIYSSYLSNIQNSENSYIWNSIRSSIICSKDSRIGYDYTSDSITSTSKTSTSLIFSDVSGLTCGQLVTLYGAEYTSPTKYQIAEIDEVNKSIRFVNELYNYITFDISNSYTISMKPLNVQTINATIISNTSDTIVLGNNLTSANYATIDGYTQKYTVVDIPDSFNIKLRLFESDSLVTDLVPNSLSGKTIRLYKGSNITASMILGGSSNIIYNGDAISIIASNSNTIYNGGSALIGASGYNNINNFSMTSILSGLRNYVSQGSNNAIIAARGNYITNCVVSGILCSDGNYITDCENSIILGGGNHFTNGDTSGVLCGDGNYIENLNNVAIIACNGVHATRPNVLMTSSLTLVNKTLELNGRTPSIGDVLVVESIEGNVATVTWGKPSTSAINSLFETATYTLWGESVISHQYIKVTNAPENSYISENMAVGLTTNGLINDDYLGYWSSTAVASSNNGIPIDVGYKYIIKFDSFDSEWVDSSDQAPNVAMSTSTILTIVNNPAPDNNYCISYTTNTGLSGRIVDGWNVLSGMLGIPNFSASGASSPKFNIYIHRPGSIDNAIATFAVCNIPESGAYAEPIETSIYTDSNGLGYIIWPTDYDLPTGGSVEYAWFKAPDAAMGLNTYEWRAIISVTEATRAVRIDAGGNPNVPYTPCYLWYMKESPRFNVSTNISVIKMSTSIFP